MHDHSTPKSFAAGPPIFNPPPRGADTAELARALDADITRLDGRELGTALTRRAVARYWEALRRVDETTDRGEGRPELERWVDVAVGDLLAAETILTRAILAWGDSQSWGCPEKTAHPPHGVIEGGRLYLAIQSPDDDTPIGQSRDGYKVMRLAVIDLGNVMVLGTKGGAR